MDLISKLEKRFGSWAIPNLTVYLIVVQAIGVFLLLGGHADSMDLILHGSSVVHRGQWWRLLSFLMLPRTLNPLWLFFAFYIFYLMGNALEQQWGCFRYNLFILCGYLLTVSMAFINPGVIITNTFFLGCVMLAFATLFPNFVIYLFFVLPVKMKWFGWLTAAAYVYILLTGNTGSRLGVIAAFANYALFFGKAFITGVRADRRRKAFVADRAEAAAQPIHTCAECGVTDKTDEQMHFRYCSTCGRCFCEEHISNHKH